MDQNRWMLLTVDQAQSLYDFLEPANTAPVREVNDWYDQFATDMRSRVRGTRSITERQFLKIQQIAEMLDQQLEWQLSDARESRVKLIRRRLTGRVRRHQEIATLSAIELRTENQQRRLDQLLNLERQEYESELPQDQHTEDKQNV